jgi:hypothetical protein
VEVSVVVEIVVEVGVNSVNFAKLQKNHIRVADRVIIISAWDGSIATERNPFSTVCLVVGQEQVEEAPKQTTIPSANYNHK